MYQKHELAACQILHTSDARCPVGQNRLGKTKSTVEDTGHWAQGHEDHQHHSSTLKHKESQKSSECQEASTELAQGHYYSKTLLKFVNVYTTLQTCLHNPCEQSAKVHTYQVSWCSANDTAERHVTYRNKTNGEEPLGLAIDQFISSS